MFHLNPAFTQIRLVNGDNQHACLFLLGESIGTLLSVATGARRLHLAPHAQALPAGEYARERGG